MDKFIEFNGSIFNTHYIINMRKFTRYGEPNYGIILQITGKEEQQWFVDEYERDTVFNQLSRELLNE